MKKIKYTRLFSLVLTVASVVSLLWISACSEDNPVTNTPDETAPTIAITSPVPGAIGVSDAVLAVNSTITDNSELASVEITIGNGTTEVYSEMVTTFSNPKSYTYNKNINLPNNAPYGQHNLTIVATDKDGNEKTSTVALTMLPAYEDGKTTLIIKSVPTVTGNDAFYAVGQFQTWNPAARDFPATKYTDSKGVVSYYVLVPNTAGSGDGYKFVRSTPDCTDCWPYGEKDADGKQIDNRKFAADAKFVELEIGSWEDHNPTLSNNAGGTVISIGGTLSTTKTTISGSLGKSRTGMNEIASASYSFEKKNGTAWEPVTGKTNVALELGAPDANGNKAYSAEVDIAALTLGEYRIVVKGLDSKGFKVRDDKTLLIVEFPCSEAGLPAVAATKTRLFINVPSTTDDIYLTGTVNGVALWPSADTDYTKFTDDVKFVKVSNTCYYLDVTLAKSDNLQFIRRNGTFTAWWQGQATNTAGSDATASYSVTDASSGATVKIFYAYWRTNP